MFVCLFLLFFFFFFISFFSSNLKLLTAMGVKLVGVSIGMIITLISFSVNNRILSQLAIGSTVLKPYSFREIGRLSEKQLIKAGASMEQLC